MSLFRGILLIGLGAFVLYQGWHLQQLHNMPRALLAYTLAVVSIALGVWRLTRRPDRLRR